MKMVKALKLFLISSLLTSYAFSQAPIGGFVSCQDANPQHYGLSSKECFELAKIFSQAKLPTYFPASNWFSGAPLSSWQGLTVGVTSDGLSTVKRIVLNNKGLVGIIENVNLSNLPNLERIDMSQNALFGKTLKISLPHANLVSINLNNNKLNFMEPTLLKNSLKLNSIDLSFNKIRGLFPNVKDKVFLENLIIEKNFLSGPLVSEMLPSSLKILVVRDNCLSIDPNLANQLSYIQTLILYQQYLPNSNGTCFYQ
jgi:hypothetical protein